MHYNNLRQFFGKTVAVVVQGHPMFGVLTELSHTNPLLGSEFFGSDVVGLNSGDSSDLYDQALIEVSQIGAIKALKPAAVTAQKV